jgi:predicted ABC-type ATPase
VAAGNSPTCRVIAGPNGAGKTTFALTWLPQVAPGSAFINADLIAAGLSPLAPERQQIAASRLFLREIDRAVKARRDFAFETTLAGLGYLRLLQRLRADGWRIELSYLALPSVQLCIQRVSERVRHGGHAIPRADIERRFPRSLYNLLYRYGPTADHTRCLLNSGPTPELVFVQRGADRTILRPDIFTHLESAAHP